MRSAARTSSTVDRDDASGRDFESLPREVKLLHGQGEARFGYHEGENLFEVDLLGDMKTGAFLDQVDNHVRAGELARGEGLDLFSYHGGFALALSRSCDSVLAALFKPYLHDVVPRSVDVIVPVTFASSSRS